MDDRCIQGLDSIPPSLKGCVLTVGNFDGVHLGHRRILQTARALASEAAVPAVAMTFEPPPDLVLRPDDKPQRLTLPPEKTRLLLQAGADHVVIAAADAGLLSLTGEEFIERVIVERFSPAQVVEGNNFFFGAGRSGNIGTLQAASAEGGFLVHVVAAAMAELPDGPRRISSTLIRSLLIAGCVADAAGCLGRPYELAGPVKAGAGRGRKLDYPTINVAPNQQVLPADGVYAGIATVDGNELPAAVSIGAQPTFDSGGRVVEAFLIDVDGDFYDKSVALKFVQRLREQVCFDGPDSLKAQMAKDVERVREILG